MSSVQQKNHRHTKKQESMAPKRGKVTAFEGTQRVGLVNKDLKAPITNKFEKPKETILEELRDGYDDRVSPKRISIKRQKS